MLIPVKRLALLGLSTLVALNAGACASDTGLPGAPTSRSHSGVPGPAASTPWGTNALKLVEVAGSIPAGGSGIVNVTPTRIPGTNNFEITVNVHGAPPDVDLYFQIRGDTGLGAQQADGICNRGLASPPPPAGFLVLHTSPGGAASAHGPIETTSPFFDPGVVSDFMYRVVDFDQTFELRTACVQFTGQ